MVKSASRPPFGCSLETFRYGSRMNIAPPEARENRFASWIRVFLFSESSIKGWFQPVHNDESAAIVGVSGHERFYKIIQTCPVDHHSWLGYCGRLILSSPMNRHLTPISLPVVCFLWSCSLRRSRWSSCHTYPSIRLSLTAIGKAILRVQS
jgi:hypothetical protein